MAVQRPPATDSVNWTSVVQVGLGASGIVAATVYAVGWTYWQGYFRYFHLSNGLAAPSPSDSIALGIWHLFPASGLALYLAAYLLLRRRSDGVRLEKILERLEDVKLRSARGEAVGEELSAIERNLKEIQELPQTGFLKNFSQKVLTSPNFLLRVGSLIALPLISSVAVICLSWYITFQSDGTTSAWAGLPALVGYIAIWILAVVTAQLVIDKSWGWRLILVAVGLICVIPLTAYTDGRLSAYAAWHSTDPESHFPSVRFYAERRLDADWSPSGNVFISPTKLLIRRIGDDYFVVPNDHDNHVLKLVGSNIIAVESVPLPSQNVTPSPSPSTSSGR